MKELNNLVASAEKADAVGSLMDGVNPHYILAIADAFQALEQRAEAAEAKLAELEKQEPNHAQCCAEAGGDISICDCVNKDWVYLSTIDSRPAPAVSLAELVPDKKSTDIDYAFYPLTKARHEGYNDCIAEILRKIEEAK